MASPLNTTGSMSTVQNAWNRSVLDLEFDVRFGDICTNVMRYLKDGASQISLLFYIPFRHVAYGFLNSF